MTTEFLRLLQKLQPFFMVWTSSGKIVYVSDLLLRIWQTPSDQIESLGPRLRLVRPFEAVFNFGWNNELRDLRVELTIDEGLAIVKGQFVTLDDDFIAFVGSPLIGYHKQLENLGLKLSDLPLHDRLGDLIIANEANKVSLNQALESQVDLTARNAELRKVNEVIEKFVPTQFLGALGVQSLAEARRGLHARAELAVMFGDLRNFSTITEPMEPNQVMDFVNHYLSHVSPAVQANGGVIAQYLGDGVMAVFPGSTDVAIEATLEIQRAIRRFALEAFPFEPQKLRMGIGLHFGAVELGIIGDQDRWDSAVLSDVTNTAARIEGLTKDLGADIIISDVVLKNLNHPETFEFRRLGRFRVKGRQSHVEILELLNSLPPEILERRLATRPALEKGVTANAQGNFADALAAFEEVLRIDPNDTGAQTLLRRCQRGEAI
jgi:class 3 adenylate cyclase